MILMDAPVVVPGTLLERGQALLGLGAFVLICYALGKAWGAKSFPARVVIWGIVLQFIFGSIVLFAPGVLATVQYGIQELLNVTVDGARIVFGNLVNYALPVKDDAGRQLGWVQPAAVFGFVVLPTIIFISMLTSMLYHLGVLTWVVRGLAWVMQRTMGTSGAETLSTAANIFVGQTEAPLLVRPFLLAATRSELMAIMVGGFANIASGVLIVYSDLLQNYVSNAGGHLAAACFISAPATLIVAKLLMPETEQPVTANTSAVSVEKMDLNLVDAATRGTTEGLRLAVNVGAMLISFTALISLINIVIAAVFGKMGMPGASLQAGLGYVCAPIAWLCGIEWNDCLKVGSLLGVKTAINEFIAYQQMSASYGADPAYLTPRSGLLATYALCGFANFASVGIQIGGISVLAPERRHELSRIGLKAMLGGAIASCMGACVVGILV